MNIGERGGKLREGLRVEMFYEACQAKDKRIAGQKGTNTCNVCGVCYAARNTFFGARPLSISYCLFAS